MKITPSSNAANNGRWVGNVPAEAGTGFRRASDPASARTKIIGANLLSNITMPSTELYHTVFTDKPANAEPLLLLVEVNA
jgi:hypothetical protein